MLNILADVLLLATGHRPVRKQHALPADADWNEGFIPSRSRADGQVRKPAGRDVTR